MTGRLVVLNLIGIALVIAASSALADPAPPQMTADQAILIARDYCKSVGEPVTEPGTATFPAPARPMHDPPEPDRYWLPRWSVTFPGQATVEVVDQTGVIRDYWNDSLDSKLRGTPAGPDITAEQAIRVATKALRETGQPMDELALSQTIHAAASDQASSHVWYVIWDRLSNGAPYAGQGANVVIQAQTADVNGLGLTFASPPAAPSTIRFDGSHAAQKALERLAQRGVKTALIYSEDAEYVVPDHSSPNGDPPTEFVAPRLAWVARAATDGYPMDEWIDAESGSVIGETTHMPGGPITRPKGIETNAHILADAKEVKIQRRTAKYEWPKKPAAVLSEKSNPEVFKLLKASEPSSIKDLLVAPEFQLEVTTSNPWIAKLYYLPDRNLVGNGVDWLTPPAGFQKWMEKLGGKKMK